MAVTSLQLEKYKIENEQKEYKDKLAFIKAGNSLDTFVILNNYETHGERHRKRLDTEIRIENKGNLIFKGTFDELEEKLKK